MLRIGRISSVNYLSGKARVTFEDRDDCVSAELPFLDWIYKMPSPGKRVAVVMDNGIGVILGGIYSIDNAPLGEIGKTVFPMGDGAELTYKDGVLKLSSNTIRFEGNQNITSDDIIKRLEALEQKVGG